MRRLEEGFAGVVNPFGGCKYIVSLRPEDVVCFVFWSKNFAPFIEKLQAIDSLGYKFYFNYTITALPEVFENNVDKRAAVEALKELSRTYSRRHINWRFDPIIISNICGRDFYVRTCRFSWRTTVTPIVPLRLLPLPGRFLLRSRFRPIAGGIGRFV